MSPSPPRKQDLPGTIVRKLGVAAAVFAATLGSWSLVNGRLMHDTGSPLPDVVAPGERGGVCALWFVGSSTMHKWSTLAQDMRPWVAHNRGVNGASLSEINARLSHEPVPSLRPRGVVVYVGDNDIALGETPGAAIAELETLLAEKRRLLGDVPTFVISLKPSPTRWRFLPQQRTFNVAARRIAAARADVHYIDIVPLMLVNGRPGAFYQPDGIHLNAIGYARWAGAVRPALARDIPADVVRACMRPSAGAAPGGKAAK